MSEIPKKRIIFEGWRFIPHSSAITLQFYCLSALRRPNLDIKVRDLPFNGPWSRIGGMFPETIDRTLQALPVASPGETADAIVRIGSPIDLSPAPGGIRTFVMASHGAGSSVNLPMTKNTNLLESIAENSDTILLTPSQFSCDSLVTQGIPADRIRMVPRGIDPGFFRPPSETERESLRSRFGWTEEFIFLNVSAMTDNKGIEKLIRAFAVILIQYPQARLVLKGVDSIYHSKDRITGILRRIPPETVAAVQPRMTYIGGNYKLIDMTRLYQCADVLVTPYLSEAFCSPVLEAAACGLPSICTQGGPTEEITDEEFSLRTRAVWNQKSRILEPDDTHLAQCMAFAIGNASWRERAIITSADFAARRFTWDQATDKLLQAMEL